MAPEADTARTKRMTTIVALGGAKRLRLAKIMASQNTRITRKGAGIGSLAWADTRKRVCARSVATAVARACRDRCASFLRSHLSSRCDGWRQKRNRTCHFPPDCAPSAGCLLAKRPRHPADDISSGLDNSVHLIFRQGETGRYHG
jgi:hypothetical protein